MYDKQELALKSKGLSLEQGFRGQADLGQGFQQAIQPVLSCPECLLALAGGAPICSQQLQLGQGLLQQGRIG